jgi:uncharacterized protein (DUF433 family)
MGETPEAAWESSILDSGARRHEEACSARVRDVLAMGTVILSDPEIMGGTPCFAGTRVPFQTLLDFLKAGDPLEEFLDSFPSVTRDMASMALQEAGDLAIAAAMSRSACSSAGG